MDRLDIQGDLLNIAVFFWFLVKVTCSVFSVRCCTRVHDLGFDLFFYGFCMPGFYIVK